MDTRLLRAAPIERNAGARSLSFSGARSRHCVILVPFVCTKVSPPMNTPAHSSLRLASLVLGGLVTFTGCSKKEEPAVQPEVSAARLAELTSGVSLEKTDLKLGFIKLTDCAPLIVAKELGFFKEEGLNVKLEAQANWKLVLDRVVSGELDGSHMLASQPVGATAGVGMQASIITPYVLETNGNGITLSNKVWESMQAQDPKLKVAAPEHPISAKSLVPVAQAAKAKGAPLQFGITFPISTHNYELRYWLAAGGVHPGLYTPDDTTGTRNADVLLSVTPPPQMPATMEAGTISGYCVGEPWNEQAVMKGIGTVVASSDEIIEGRPEKVFGVTETFAKTNPKTTVALVKALLRAGKWLDASMENRKQAVTLLARKEYVGADETVLANSMTGTFLYQKEDRREKPNFNVFFKDGATYPYYSDAVWFLTQMRRWGQISEPKPDGWYHEMAKKAYAPAIYLEAARALVTEKKLEESDVPWNTDGYEPPNEKIIDGKVFDGKKPLEYLKKHTLGNTD